MLYQVLNIKTGDVKTVEAEGTLNALEKVMSEFPNMFGDNGSFRVKSLNDHEIKTDRLHEYANSELTYVANMIGEEDEKTS